VTASLSGNGLSIRETRSLGLGNARSPAVTDQSPASPSLRAAAGGTSAELTLDDAQKLYEKFADKDGGDAVWVMAQIALWGKRQQVERGRLRLLALRR
jgi:hypothetical protein